MECQLNTLQRCPSEYHLDRSLNSLPRDLDETYERMLCNIDDQFIADARRIFTLLCFASRPLTVQELIEGIAVEINHPAGFNYKRRLKDYSDIHEICPGFIDISFGPGRDYSQVEDSEEEQEEKIPTVRIAHLSVQEYFISGRIQQSKARPFGLISHTAHAEIAKICLIYLLEDGLSSSKYHQGGLKEYPLAEYAAEQWYHHYNSAEHLAIESDQLIVRLFERKESFVTWVRLYDVDQVAWNRKLFLGRKPDGIASPPYYASLLGLERFLQVLINPQRSRSGSAPIESSTTTSKSSKIINVAEGNHGSALQAAAREGHERVVQLLLDSGAEVNGASGEHCTALRGASEGGHIAVVQLLLDRGADVNAGSEGYEAALYAASEGNHAAIVQLLLERGADVNASKKRSDTALQAASYGGDETIVHLLLDKGADVNAPGNGTLGTALQAASHGVHENIVRLLMEKGADVNAHSGFYGTALQTASVKGDETIVHLLMDRGADINARSCGSSGPALQEASGHGHETIVQLLLDRGADVNAHTDPPWGTALQAAATWGYLAIVQLLLDRGAAVVNARGNQGYDTALKAASRKGHNAIVQLLRNKGAETL